ncbi:hypothetical protein I7I53_10142 [Histoplasma capsulatum var. duboisii H88]|uniref:Uncharacterized protein n=1 Tax=Ajellomyces capsulatus (strain H88) TaxID=544711 RepID=A0A8A1L7W2_AJEC8|nr:hypothetical protein I7I53_10142 [Histoplasma capsulatum var. duboisii H88]
MQTEIQPYMVTRRTPMSTSQHGTCSARCEQMQQNCQIRSNHSLHKPLKLQHETGVFEGYLTRFLGRFQNSFLHLTCLQCEESCRQRDFGHPRKL